MGPRVTVDEAGRAAYPHMSLSAGVHVLAAWRYEKRDSTWVKVAEAAPVRVRVEIRVTELED